MPMIGTLANVAGICIGGLIGIFRGGSVSPARESLFKVLLGVFTVFYGLQLAWLSLKGSPGQFFKRLLIIVLALILGKLLGQRLHLQKLSNRIGQWSLKGLAAAPSQGRKPSLGFKICAALFCAAPLGILGAVQDGLSGYFYPLVIKGVMEGLGMIGLAAALGWGTLLSAVPVLVLQGTITLLCSQYLAPWLRGHLLVDPINAAGGLLVFSVALVILELKKIELADYLPSLIVAPLLAWSLHY
jgi:uncharacterized membrane protein YqgA involved in biofilm formation